MGSGGGQSDNRRLRGGLDEADELNRLRLRRGGLDDLHRSKRRGKAGADGLNSGHSSRSGRGLGLVEGTSKSSTKTSTTSQLNDLNLAGAAGANDGGADAQHLGAGHRHQTENEDALNNRKKVMFSEKQEKSCIFPQKSKLEHMP